MTESSFLAEILPEDGHYDRLTKFKRKILLLNFFQEIFFCLKLPLAILEKDRFIWKTSAPPAAVFSRVTEKEGAHKDSSKH